MLLVSEPVLSISRFMSCAERPSLLFKMSPRGLDYGDVDEVSSSGVLEKWLPRLPHPMAR